MLPNMAPSDSGVVPTRSTQNGRKTLDANQYTVGIVCTLPYETAALIATLDETHGGLPQDPTDNNSYILGSIHGHNIVLATLPAGQRGTSPAAAASKDMIRTFKSIRYGLLVGIGGGAASPDHDIRLGDIVVSQPDGQFGGLVQFDLGTTRHGRFERLGQINSPPKGLLTALNTMKAHMEVLGDNIQENLAQMIQSHPVMGLEYVYQGALNDVLFPPQYIHVDSDNNKNNCKNCNNSFQLKRNPRQASDPVIHFGTIASGNTAISDAKLRDDLYSELGALCFETEAAGLVDFPCLVIRGISHYCDSHKYTLWQRYSAATAAAVAKEILSFLPAQMAHSDLPIIQKSGSIQYPDQVQTGSIYGTEERECLQFFDVCPYQQYKDINPLRVNDTCLWVFTHPQYVKWVQSSKDDLIWVSADPGCGKSVLSRSLLEEFQVDNLCYFFFKDNPDQNNIAVAICSLIHQLFEQNPHLIRHGIQKWESKKNTLKRDPRDLWDIFTSAAFEAGNVICVLDALDECQKADRSILVKLLNKFYESSFKEGRTTWLKVLVTSRPYHDIETEFRGLPSDLPAIRLSGENETKAIQKEISLVITSRVEQLAQELELTNQDKIAIEQRLQSMENRTYLWLYLVIEQLKTSFYRGKRLVELTNIIPPDVESAYESMLNRNTGSSELQKEAKKVLCLIIGARRPLTITEMSIAFNLTIQLPNKLRADFDTNEAYMKTQIRNLCGLFVSIHDERVYLIHQTAKEFLLFQEMSIQGSIWKHCIQEKDCDIIFARICIFSLLELGLNSGLSKEAVEVYGKLGDLEDYASENWPAHFQRAEFDETDEIISEALHLYDKDNLGFTSWFDLFHGEYVCFYEVGNMKTSQSPRSLSVASFNGHINIAKLLLERKLDINSIDPYYGTALTAASLGAHEAVLNLLLERGANINTRGGYYYTPLVAASSMNHMKIVTLLLDKGADINSDDPEVDCGSALSSAAKGGLEAIVRLLLDRGANVDTDENCTTALSAAASVGNDDMVNLLLDRGANINAQSNIGTPIYCAAQIRYIKTLQLLLDRGADINAPGGYYGYALQFAAERGEEKMVNLLLDSGANVNSQGGFYGNALQAAAQRIGYAATGLDVLMLVRLLLEKGADINAKGGYYGNALQASVAAWPYSHKIGAIMMLVQLLLDRGADINARGGHFGTVLQAAAFMENETAVEFVLENGADVNAKGGYYGTALQAASYKENNELVNILLDAGAGVNVQGGFCGTALQAAAASRSSSLTAMKTLLDKGADVNIQGWQYDDDLGTISEQDFAQEDHPLEDNVYGNSRTERFGKSALHWAAERNKVSKVELLLQYQCNPNALDFHGQTPLHYAAENCYEEVARSLIPMTNASTKDEKGRTALQCARDNGHEAMVRLLSPFWTKDDFESKDLQDKSFMDWMTQLEFWDNDSRAWKNIPPNMPLPEQGKSKPDTPASKKSLAKIKQKNSPMINTGESNKLQARRSERIRNIGQR